MTGKTTVPAAIPPMLARLSTMPARREEYLYEFKWDGIRAIVSVNAGEVRIHSRNLKELTIAFPEVDAAGASIRQSGLVLDGEIVAFDDAGRPSFGALQQRMHIASAREAERRAISIPAMYMVFDVLYFKGECLMGLPLVERRRVLEKIRLPKHHWKLSVAYDDGEQLYAAAQEAELEGIIAKRRDSPYRLGGRTSEWLKIKIVQSDDFIIGGWTDESTGRASLGAVLMGYFKELNSVNRLQYVGKVGTGFTEKVKTDLMGRLRKLETKTNPFHPGLPRGKYHFASPQLVAEIEYRGWTSDGKLRQAAFKGLRLDKNASEVTGPEILMEA